MHRHAVGNCAPRNRGAIVWPSVATQRDGTMVCTWTEVVAVPQDDDGVIGFTDLTGVFDYRFENRFDIRWRRSDHIQDVGAAGLVSEGFGQVLRFGLDLVEQSRVLDSDYGLVGEGAQEFNEFVGEAAGFAPRDPNRADCNAFPHHRNHKEATIAS